jgi:hypothetical protein
MPALIIVALVVSASVTAGLTWLLWRMNKPQE